MSASYEELRYTPRLSAKFKYNSTRNMYSSLVREFGYPNSVLQKNGVIICHWTRQAMRDRLQPWYDITLRDEKVKYKTPYVFNSQIYFRYYLPIIKGTGIYAKAYIPQYYPDYQDIDPATISCELNQFADNVSYNADTAMLTIHTFSSATAYAICTLAIQLVERYNFPGKPGNLDERRDLHIVQKYGFLKKMMYSVIPGTENYRFDFSKYYKRVISMYGRTSRIYQQVHFPFTEI